MNKRLLVFIVVVGYCDGSFDSFCVIGFDRIVARSSILHCFAVMSPSCGFVPKYSLLCNFGKYHLCAILLRYRLRSDMSPLRDSHCEICALKW
jgi:hypothetical protein